MIHVAYKHLDSKLKFGDLTVGQWLGIALGILVGVGWGMYVCPFGTYLTLASSVYIGALPAGAAMLASVSEFDLMLLVRAMVRWRRRDGRYAAGPGESVRGYVVVPAPVSESRARDDVPEIDLAALWGETR